MPSALVQRKLNDGRHYEKLKKAGQRLIEVVCPVCKKTRKIRYWSMIRNRFKYGLDGSKKPPSCRKCFISKRDLQMATERAQRVIVPAKVPTYHLPGTPGKLAVMEQRFLDGESLFHPDDPVISYDRYKAMWEVFLEPEHRGSGEKLPDDRYEGDIDLDDF